MRRSATRPRLVPVMLSVATLFTFGACGDGSSSSDHGASTRPSSTTLTSTPSASGSITVSAAASLTEVFGRIRADFVDANPDATVTINFGSSGQLATQIQAGAPADVAAFADEAPMTILADAGLLAAPARIFARNQLVIVTKPGNPNDIDSLADLADLGSSGVVSLCAETAPCGKFADQILTNAGVSIPAGRITRGPDVLATLSAVAECDADAAIVYVTDARSAADAVDAVDIPESSNVTASYPIAVIRGSDNEATASAFQEFVLGDAGQQALAEAGFLAP